MRIFLRTLIFLIPIMTSAQISIPSTTPVAENFNGMNATLNLPANWRMHASTSSPTWTGASTTVTQQSSGPSPTAGGTYNWGSTAAERAVGAMTSGTFASPNNLLVFYSNGHATDNITSLSINYDAERYRVNSAAASVQFYYSLDGTSWTSVAAGDIAAASFPTGASSYTFASPLTINKTGVTISSLNILPGSSFYLRWNINTTGSNSQGIGIDNVSVTATFSAATNTISTTSVGGNPFSVDCAGTGNGTVDFTSTGIFTVGNVYTAQLSNSTGSFAAPVSIGNLSSTANSGTINISIPAATASGTGYRIRVISSSPSINGTDNGSNLTVTFTPCSISTGTVSSSPFNVNCTTNASASGSVDFTSSGTYDVSNIYSAQLSDATGSFTTATTIGTLTSSANSGTINIVIPSETVSGTAYRIRVASSNPIITGSNNGTDLSIIQNAPCAPSFPLPGLLINEFSNGDAGNREYYEFVVAGQCGQLVDVRGYIIDDNNGTFSASFPLAGSGIAAGHMRLTQHAQWASIPVGSLIVVYNATEVNTSLPADDPFDANNDSLYVIPHNNAALFEINATIPSNTTPDSTYSPATYGSTSWTPMGLANSGDAVQVRTPDGSYWHGVSYGGAEITGGPNDMKILNTSMSGLVGWFNDGNVLDASNWSTGAVATFETPGVPNNAANLAWLIEMRDPNSTVCPIIVLPSELISFTGKYSNNQTELKWQTASELNNDYFTLYHSVTGYDFKKIGQISGAGTSESLKEYRFNHLSPSPRINYYKLESRDYDGKTYYKGIIAVEAEFNFSYYNTVTHTIELHYEAEVDIYSTDGKLILSTLKTNSIPFTNPGMFLIVNKETGLTERLFVPELK